MENLRQLIFPICLMLAMYVIVLLAMLVDLRSGIRKAKIRKEFRSSYGFRKTIQKGNQYLNFLLIMSLIDVIQMATIVSWVSQVSYSIPKVPIFTIICAICLCLIEFKSVREKADEKLKKDFTENMTSALKLLSDDDKMEVITSIFHLIKEDKKRKEEIEN